MGIIFDGMPQKQLCKNIGTYMYIAKLGLIDCKSRRVLHEPSGKFVFALPAVVEPFITLPC